ncbi:MAG: XRE family transcriptional regulator [Tannerella sp.]|jgi:hypothetical protein|nr:XRE family transcriptional regulator [Tannerella sp.]
MEHWNEQQKKYALTSAGQVTVEDIALNIGRSPRAVKLFLHRNKVNIGRTVKHNLTLTILQRKFGHPEYFYPTRQFFNTVKINQRRWWDLYYGRKQICREEYERLCSHLNISPEDSFEARQIELFE